MRRYVLRRVASAVAVVVATLLISFVLFFVAPRDPVGAVCGAKCPPERAAEIAASLHLDDPVPSQFGQYAWGIVAGRTITSGGTTVECAVPCLGYSYKLGQPVTALIADAAPVTFSIVLGAALVYLVVGVANGVVAARRRGSALDRLTVGGTLVLSSVPYFVVALVFALYVAGRVLPPSQYTSPLASPLGWASGLLAAWITLGLVNAAAYTRYSRASMIEALGEDFVRTARGKGISERRVVYRHALRAALGPVTTIFGIDLAAQLTGAIFTERIFGLPGLGTLTLNAFAQNDMPVIMGSVLVGAVLLVTLNLAVDLMYTVLDPRVRLG
ncbi:peptide ABC transporter permease [Pilimelia terevasa]|uniref:Peptide ABC transporter permease n=1 Tax=Pilimelia terevasa TaxID=53372 RepID=A0A8J3FFG4_9ACTN|nr:ABC transporter permease [Pilimelia terevasa]GGK12740.1 peptide ABC transporter permease [Pilimelia terevasa]